MARRSRSTACPSPCSPGRVTGFVGPNGVRQVHHDAADPRAGHGRRGNARRSAAGRTDRYGRRLTQVGALLDAAAVHPGRRASRPPALAGPQQRPGQAPGRRGAGPGRAGERGPQTRRRLLPRHAPAARHRRGAARRPADPDAGRTGERARPGRHRVDPWSVAAAGRRGPRGVRLQPPDGRAGGHREPPAGDRPRPADRGHRGPGPAGRRVRVRVCRSGRHSAPR